eukprot:CAMPEP_0185025604 /NCGR_PEP_ID=MMETSP1103-20130426/8501_1 /TAXON_ID=36769 /ORGANISM="Paraphysomonas bandaiensis, Strain Caron Lab Isolate" /LENGTH=111 /DNA_ID=CAMNT_0027558843 /DNA_START=46 /DNA_END=381 /DNA_ORIENTATION=-
MTAAGRVSISIRNKLSALNPLFLDVINESHKHNVPEGSESHFKVVIVSAAFEGQNHLARHRLVNGILQEELKNDIHALSILAKTPEQWEENSTVTKSPPCLGGSKESSDKE